MEIQYSVQFLQITRSCHCGTTKKKPKQTAECCIGTECRGTEYASHLYINVCVSSILFILHFSLQSFLHLFSVHEHTHKIPHLNANFFMGCLAASRCVKQMAVFMMMNIDGDTQIEEMKKRHLARTVCPR